MQRNTHSKLKALSLRSLAAVLLVIGCIAITGCVVGDASASQPDQTDEAQSAAQLRAQAEQHRAHAASQMWLANTGRGSGGLFDMSGIELRRAAGVTRAQLERQAEDALDRASELAHRARAIETASGDALDR